MTAAAPPASQCADRPSPAGREDIMLARHLAPVSAAARCDANGTMWRLRSLIAMGHDSTRIARALHVPPPLVRRVICGQARTIAAGFRASSCQLWDAWWDKTPPQRTPAERRARARALRQARTFDWPAAAGLDEDQLDQPGYRPWCQYRPATGTGAAPDFPPARPRPARDREIA
jgi:hypothetical protein